jgi:hypothetical protein
MVIQSSVLRVILGKDIPFVYLTMNVPLMKSNNLMMENA